MNKRLKTRERKSLMKFLMMSMTKQIRLSKDFSVRALLMTTKDRDYLRP